MQNLSGNNKNQWLFTSSFVYLGLNFAIIASEERMKKLKLSDGSLVLIKSKNNNEIISKIISNPICPFEIAKIPESMKISLKLQIGEQITISPYKKESYCTDMQVEPQFETNGKKYTKLINNYLSTDSHPISIGSFFIIYDNDKSLLFKVKNCLPENHCIASRATKIYQTDPLRIVRFGSTLNTFFSDISLDEDTLTKIQKLILCPFANSSVNNSKSSNKSNNVLIIGGKGSGKTSILSAIANYDCKSNKKDSVLYVDIGRVMDLDPEEALDIIEKSFIYPNGKEFCLIMFDDLHFLIEKASSKKHKKMIDMFLNSLEDTSNMKNTIVIATTNSKEFLNALIDQKKCFGHQINLDKKSPKQQQQIIQTYTSGFKSLTSQDIKIIASTVAEEMNPSEIRKLVKTAIDNLTKEMTKRNTDKDIASVLTGSLTSQHFGCKQKFPSLINDSASDPFENDISNDSNPNFGAQPKLKRKGFNNPFSNEQINMVNPFNKTSKDNKTQKPRRKVNPFSTNSDEEDNSNEKQNVESRQNSNYLQDNVDNPFADEETNSDDSSLSPRFQQQSSSQNKRKPFKDPFASAGEKSYDVKPPKRKHIFSSNEQPSHFQNSRSVKDNEENIQSNDRFAEKKKSVFSPVLSEEQSKEKQTFPKTPFAPQVNEPILDNQKKEIDSSFPQSNNPESNNGEALLTRRRTIFAVDDDTDDDSDNSIPINFSNKSHKNPFSSSNESNVPKRKLSKNDIFNQSKINSLKNPFGNSNESNVPKRKQSKNDIFDQPKINSLKNPFGSSNDSNIPKRKPSKNDIFDQSNSFSQNNPFNSSTTSKNPFESNLGYNQNLSSTNNFPGRKTERNFYGQRRASSDFPERKNQNSFHSAFEFSNQGDTKYLLAQDNNNSNSPENPFQFSNQNSLEIIDISTPQKLAENSIRSIFANSDETDNSSNQRVNDSTPLYLPVLPNSQKQKSSNLNSGEFQQNNGNPMTESTQMLYNDYQNNIPFKSNLNQSSQNQGSYDFGSSTRNNVFNSNQNLKEMFLQNNNDIFRSNQSSNAIELSNQNTNFPSRKKIDAFHSDTNFDNLDVFNRNSKFDNNDRNNSFNSNKNLNDFGSSNRNFNVPKNNKNDIFSSNKSSKRKNPFKSVLNNADDDSDDDNFNKFSSRRRDSIPSNEKIHAKTDDNNGFSNFNAKIETNDLSDTLTRDSKQRIQGVVIRRSKFEDDDDSYKNNNLSDAEVFSRHKATNQQLSMPSRKQQSSSQDNSNFFHLNDPFRNSNNSKITLNTPSFDSNPSTQQISKLFGGSESFGQNDPFATISHNSGYIGKDFGKNSFKSDMNNNVNQFGSFTNKRDNMQPIERRNDFPQRNKKSQQQFPDDLLNF